MRVIFSPKSLRDLRDIGDFIALDNPKRADTFILEIEAACKALSSNALRYPLLERPEGYRRIPFDRYLVLYRVTLTEVRIVRVIHGARDLRDLDP